MNCSDFQNISHELARGKVEGCEKIEALAHASDCVGCAEYLEAERRLALKLGFLSQALHGHEAPERLESALLTAFRERSEASVPQHSGPRFWAHQKFWAWGATAAALAAMIALAMGIQSRRSSQPRTSAAAITSSTTAQESSATSKAVATPDDTSEARPAISSLRRNRTATPRIRAVRTEGTTIADNSGFVPLVYCDQLNCSTPGEIVRVEIPASSLPMMGLVNDNRTGPVRADVVVGEDGIARAIRLVDY
jgi:hypothetical protein